MAPPPGRMPRIEPSAVPRRTGPMIRLKSAFGQHQAADVPDHDGAGVLVLQVAQDLAEAEDAHAERHEVEPVGHFRHVEGEALGAGLDVAADQAEQQAEHDHGEGLEQRAAGERHRGDQAQHHQREVLRRAELQRHVGQRRRRQHQQEGRDRAGEEGAQRGGGERRAGAALFGHLVAVDRRDHAGTFARQVDQDRGGRAAVLRAVVDAGQHDQGRDRRQAEGDRQQHGDGGDRAEAGQHADRRAEQHADEAVEQVERAERRGEAEPEIAEQFHGGSLLPGCGVGGSAVMPVRWALVTSNRH